MAKLVCVLATVILISSITVSDRISLPSGGLFQIGVGQKVITVGTVAEAAGTADYTCDGVDDNVQFQEALDALPANGGKISVLTGDYVFSATVTRAIANVTVEGNGLSSNFTYNGVNPLFTAGGNNWVFSNIGTDAGSINMGATTGWMWTFVSDGTFYAYRSPYGQSVFNDVTVTALTDSGLTSGRVPIAGVGGLLGDSGNLTWSDNTLVVSTSNVTNLNAGGTVVTSLTDSGLTSGRIPIVGVGGLLGDSGNLTWSDNTLITTTSNITNLNVGSRQVRDTGTQLQIDSHSIPRTATFVLATSNSSLQSLAQSDYVCDGVADDVQFQAAHDALPASGGLIWVLEGTYNFASSVNVTSNYVSIVGSSATIQPSANTTYIYNISGNNTRIEGFTIDGNVGGNVVYYPIYADSVSNLVVKNNNILEVQQDPATLYGAAIRLNNAVAGADISENYIADGSTAYGILCGYGGASYDVRITNNRIKDMSSANGIAVYAGTYDFTVVGNVVESNGHNGIAASASRRGTIVGNTVRNATNAGESGIEVETNAAHGAGVETYDITVSGNSVTNSYYGIVVRKSGANIYDITVNGNTISTTTDTGIYANTVSRINISDNMIASSSTSGIDLTSCTIGNVIGNTTIASVTSGIILNASQRVSIVGNTIGTSNTGETTNHGIRLLGTSIRNIVSNNNISSTDGNAVGEGYAISESTSADDYNTIEGNISYNDYSPGVRIFGTHSVAYRNYIDLLMDVLAVSATQVRSNEDLSEAIPNTFTLDAQPDVPRTLSGHFDAHGNITAYSITVTGVDAKGITVTDTKTQADGWDWETSNAFATITSIIMTSRTGTGVGDTMDIGITDVLGLSNDIVATSDVYKIKKNNADATVAVAQVNATYDTYDMSVIGLAGADDFTIYYRNSLNTIVQ